MKNLIKITTVFLLIAQTISYGQTQNQDTISKSDNVKTEISSLELEKFIGVYLLEEANFQLEIIEEGDKMYIVTEFSKDVLVQKNKTTLSEPTRGVDLELIKGNDNGLKFSQNGYEAIIVKLKPKK